MIVLDITTIFCARQLTWYFIGAYIINDYITNQKITVMWLTDCLKLLGCKSNHLNNNCYQRNT